jgi:NAD(P)H-dependent nitrite reductase small subunit
MWIKVFESSEIKEKYGKSVRVDGVAVAIFRSEGQLYAYKDRCPHQSAPIAGGVVKNGELMCPYHGWKFDVKSGGLTNNNLIQLKFYKVKEENGFIFIDDKT